jgi:hypothetical protein
VVTTPDSLSVDPVFAGDRLGRNPHHSASSMPPVRCWCSAASATTWRGRPSWMKQLAHRPGVKVAIERGEGLLVEHLQ